MTLLLEDVTGVRAVDQQFNALNNDSYYIYNSETGEIVRLCDLNDADCTAGLSDNGWLMLDPDQWGDAYEYPAIYGLGHGHIALDQSDAKGSNGNWTMYSDSNPHPAPTPEVDNSEYYIYNSVTGEIIRLCNYDDAACNTVLNKEGYFMLSPDRGGDTYSYPAIFSSSGIVWDQSADLNSNGDWTMYSDSSPHIETTPEPETETEPEPTPEPETEPEPETTPEPETEPEPEPTPEPEDYESPTTENNIDGTKKDDDLSGSKKSDFMDGKKGDDTLTGIKGDDVLQGGKGNDNLFGSKGDDYLDGSKGVDILNGGKGADVFQISKGVDLVEDFSIKQGDKIALAEDGNYSIIDDPNGVLVVASAKNQLFLEGTDYDKVIAAGVDLFVQPI